MTPNMMCTNVSCHINDEHIRKSAENVVDNQKEGVLDAYIDAAIKLCNQKGITVCDCYSKWKELSKTKDITMLLANRINHPISEMHTLFADKLYEDLKKEKVEVIYDDRKVSAGVMFSDADLIGVPVRVIVSPRNMAEGVCEITTRDKSVSKKVSLDNAVAEIKELIAKLYADIEANV